jgi:hypothetical protein
MSHKQVRIWHSVLDMDTAGQNLTTSSDPDAQARPLRMTVLVLQMSFIAKDKHITVTDTGRKSYISVRCRNINCISYNMPVT